MGEVLEYVLIKSRDPLIDGHYART